MKKGLSDYFKDYYSLREEIDTVAQRKIDCVSTQKFEFAAAFRNKEKKLLRKLKSVGIKIKSLTY